jgi:hypothetical protein
MPAAHTTRTTGVHVLADMSVAKRSNAKSRRFVPHCKEIRQENRGGDEEEDEDEAGLRKKMMMKKMMIAVDEEDDDQARALNYGQVGKPGVVRLGLEHLLPCPSSIF